MTLSPIDRDVFQHEIASIAEEMSSTLRRAAYSPIIWDMIDYACGLLDSEGQLIAQAPTIPAQLGIMSTAFRHITQTIPISGWRAGDIIICNDPFAGCSHTPDIVLFYATPGAMMYFINGLQWAGYKRFDWSVVGESACADSWGRALKTREASLSIPCFAERRYGGVLDDEMLMALPPKYLPIAIEGMKALAKNGLRYPIPPYGVQNDVRAGMAASYGAR